MKKIIFSLFVFFYSLNFFSQDFETVDKVMLSYQEPKSIKNLAERIDYDFKSDIEKVRAIYTWMCLNIAYDLPSTKTLKSPEFVNYSNKDDFRRTQTQIIQEIINKAFRKRKGICLEYSLLFSQLCNLMNIENELIYGYTKLSVNKIGYIPTGKNHVWNAVKINNEWLFIDTTYGAGYIYRGVWQKEQNLNYFNAKKENLRLTHFPFAKNWQVLLKQKPLVEFCYEPFYQNAYLKYNIEIIGPNIGEIDVKNKKKIHLKIKRQKNVENIKYIFSYDNKVRTARIINDNLVTNIYLKKPKQNTNLHVYVENELALQYKIKTE
ncbi:transglutaminase domain-containing protein [uncultured Tenacibaculum sp.]|uniref:transglutaminase domain-containing protein n=1 Tax=uncultured Tenacibaculum sp. TaxID=174713 RepID=UPI00263764E2|nr:transglutaminase domain-containing protein [uncultured Tenacibaculum sp.]